MRLDMNCIPCNINQAIRISELLDLAPGVREDMMREILAHLGGSDYGLSNPEIFDGTWEIITRHAGNPDPYRETMSLYNRELLALLPAIDTHVDAAADPFQAALKAAIAGNLVDFAVHHRFSPEELMRKIETLEHTPFGIDHAERLRTRLTTARSLVYLGDNCGEIALDKLFIRRLTGWFPKLKVWFVVRGQAALNDVTLIDAGEVGMEEVATVMSNSDRTPGTVLSRVSPAVRQAFDTADVVIAKGQGNFESLIDNGRPGVFHLFMVKCEPIARLLGMKAHAVMCLENDGNLFAATSGV